MSFTAPSMAARDEERQLHIVMFPWLAFGHILPYLELSKLMAQKGHRISFVSAPRNIDRLPKIPPHLASSISLIKIPLQKVAELPDNAEATIDIHAGLMGYLKKAFDGMQDGLATFLEEALPDWIISDFAPHWLPPIAAHLQIPVAFFFIFNAQFFGFLGSANDLVTSTDYRTKPEDFMVPPKWVKFDTKVAFRRYEAKAFVGHTQENDSGFSDYYRIGTVILGSEAILIRHCNEFEPEWLGVLEELHPQPTFPAGLLPPAMDEHDADEEDETWVSIRNWLNLHDKGSVVYVALGSEVRPSQEQLSELAHGLELSGVPFFLNLRSAPGPDSAELPEGIEERVRGRGMVWRSWAPQLKILSHDSVGGFLTHSGWSSIVEALMFSLPIIGLPFVVDQSINCRVVTQNQIGLEIPRNEEDGSYTRNSVADSVRLVMLDEDGKKFRDKAKELNPLFSDRELQNRYVDNLLNFLKNHETR